MLSESEFRREKAASHLHVSNPYHPEKSFCCFRCKRDLPESHFFPIATAPVRRKLGGRIVLGGLVILTGECAFCRKQKRGKWVKHPQYCPGLDRFWSKRMQAVRASIAARGIFVGVNKDDLLGLYLQQEGCCALTGMKMNWWTKGGDGKKADASPSVDRIDSNGDYVLGNIQIVMSIVNIMKNNLPQETFIQLCQQIASHNLSL